MPNTSSNHDSEVSLSSLSSEAQRDDAPTVDVAHGLNIPLSAVSGLKRSRSPDQLEQQQDAAGTSAGTNSHQPMHDSKGTTDKVIAEIKHSISETPDRPNAAERALPLASEFVSQEQTYAACGTGMTIESGTAPTDGPLYVSIIAWKGQPMAIGTFSTNTEAARAYDRVLVSSCRERASECMAAGTPCTSTHWHPCHAPRSIIS